MTQHATARPGALGRLVDAQTAGADAGAGAGPTISYLPSRIRRRIATGTGATLVLAVASVTAAGAAQADTQYVVRSGDTVSHIAARTGTSVAAIARVNRLAGTARIRIGQQLTIPTGAVGPAATAAAPAATPQAATHTVVSGDTVSGIAARNGSSVAAIVAANGLSSRGFIRVGQQLTIPSTSAGAAVPAPVATSTPAGTHVVASGESVSGIATRYGTSVAAIAAANGLDSRAFIRVGQRLAIPSAAPTQLVSNNFLGRTYPEAVVASANINKATLLRVGVPPKAQMQATIAATAREMGLDPALAQAVAFQESGFNHASVSPANAIGAMQVIPSAGDWASLLIGRHLNLLDPNDNVTAGVTILRQLVRTSVDLPTAIAGYYQGTTSVRRGGMLADTRVYVANVQTLMTRFR
ncbi:MAG TPA: LysM peptidoglycan-binding domain-containing protein [Pengzhenrongella sp.]